MNSKPFIITLLLFFLSAPLFAQDYRSEFRAIVDGSDTAATLSLLNKWQKAKPGDPELYIAFYNYYAKKGMQEIISLETEQHGKQSMQLTDSTGKVAGYINGRLTFDAVYLKRV